MYFKYDPKLLKEKNFIDRLDGIKKRINIWSSRGLSVYGKVTIIKSFLIPKFVYVCSVLPTPNELVKQLNQLLFKFLWNSTDKVTRVSAINEYEESGLLKMINLDCVIESLRLAWLKWIFEGQNGMWKTCLQHWLEPMGGFFSLNLTTYGLTEPLLNVHVLPVQRKALQTVTRNSYGLTSFCCCSRNCHAEHRGTSPSNLQTDTTALVTVLRRHLYSSTQRRNRRFSRTP